MTNQNVMISVIVVTWNNEQTIAACLESLLSQNVTCEMEILVIDNASTDQTIKIIHDQHAAVTVTENKNNRGFAAACNQGLAATSGDLVLLVNPDTVMLDNSLLQLRERLLSDEQTLVVGPQLLDSNRTIQPSGRPLPSLSRLWLEAVTPRSWRTTGWYQQIQFGRQQFDQVASVKELSGACLLIKRDAFELNGLLDEDYFLYYEETDWFKRLAATGKQVVYYPPAKVIHHWGHSMRQNKLQTDITFFTSQMIYAGKHFSAWQQWLLRQLIVFKALLGQVRRVISQHPQADQGYYPALMALARRKDKREI